MFERTLVFLNRIKVAGVKSPDMRYAGRIAFFNALMFLSVFGGDTYADSRLTTSEYGPRTYWLGYWVLAFVPLILGLNYLALVRTTRLIYRISLPFSLTVGIGCAVSLLNFYPPFPNLGQMGALALFTVPGPVSALIAYRHFEDIRLKDRNIPFEARIEWVKERVALWRSIAVSGVFGILALAVPWMLWQSATASRDFSKATEQCLRTNYLALQCALALLYIMCCPVYESFLKAKRVTSDFFELKKAD